jgi:flagellar basal-body rod protein FlgC
MPNLSQAMRVSSTGMAAERFRMDVISVNIANANSMKTGAQDPYRRHVVRLEGNENGVQVSGIDVDQSPLQASYEPGSPFADKDGNVYKTNIEPIQEMVDMMSASRAYEANIAAFNTAKSMVKSALSIGKV